MSAITEPKMSELPVERRPVLVAMAQFAAYLVVIATARFLVGTGVNPVIPSGVGIVAAVAALRVLKRTVASLLSENKARRRVEQEN